MDHSALRALLLAGSLALVGACSGPDGSERPAAPPPSATPPGPGTTDCASRPSRCGYPDATNTGVAPGSVLREVPGELTEGEGWHYDERGWISVDTDGAVLEGISTRVPVDVTASDVTIENCRITVTGDGWGVALRHAANVVVRGNEISSPSANGPDRLNAGIIDLFGDSRDVQVIGNDIWHTSTAVHLDSGLVQDNYIHDLGYHRGDHVNGIISNGGTSPLTIRHNTVFNPNGQTDAISLFPDFAPQANRVVDGNLLAGGGWTLYAGAAADPAQEPPVTNIVVTDNRFARLYFPDSGAYGPATAFNSGGGNTWAGNVWDATGEPLAAP